ncbi:MULTISPECIES: aminotransferase class I/II-fold pyridoxal phosphate-dependent enzyme [Streptomyces]|uniref:aminotransferase class I/II-fold pyridoxal phosphate-dependent enzyme n=1 Tax=Streptomyces TaxID=1883 RepID=UPI002278D6BE
MLFALRGHDHLSVGPEQDRVPLGELGVHDRVDAHGRLLPVCGQDTTAGAASPRLAVTADGPFTGLRDDLRAKRDLLADGLARAGFGVFRPQGTYFVTTDIRPLGEHDGIAFCRELPGRCGVVAIPHAVFYDHREQGAPFVRFAFCKRTEVLRDAVERLAAL